MLYMRPYKLQHQVLHARTFYGEDLAAPLLELLNDTQSAKAVVLNFLKAVAGYRSGKDTHRATKEIESILKRAQLRLTPSWHPLPVEKGMRWSVGRGQNVPKVVTDWTRVVVHWDAIGRRMFRKQAMALSAALDLWSQGLLERVKECRRAKCGTWLYSRVAHKEFCSTQCQRHHLRATPEWRKGRAQYMKRLRHAKRERDKRNLELSKRKGK